MYFVFLVISLNFHIFLSENGVLVCVYLCVCVIKIVKNRTGGKLGEVARAIVYKRPEDPFILTLYVLRCVLSSAVRLFRVKGR